ncbi:NYN domain-containing protein [Sphingobium sp. AN641]|uniref:NYN domain-containing protein n=1 Tax=Sphingobium sp. AN641 TaxID=3133443 RepID=UPI0030C37413
MTSPDPASGNVALLIDADNASAAHFDPVMTVLAELGTVNIRRAYGNWSKPSLKNWAILSVAQSIEPQQQFDLTKGKNATDMKMTIDAMDLLFGGRVTGFGLMSSDSDFTPLASRIRQQGMPVYGFGTARTPEGFRRACTRFIDVEVLAAAESPVDSKAPVAEAPPPIRRAVKAGPVDSIESLPLPPSILRSKPADDPELIKLLIDAYGSAKRDERGFVRLGTVGQLAGNRSSFDVRNYGFKRLSDLIGELPNFITETREGGHTWIKRVH